MGQKVNPIGLRLGINRTWDSRWFAEGQNYGRLLHQDVRLREFLRKRLLQAGVSRILIERPHKKCRVTIYAARPGVVIGKKGADIEKLRKDISALTEGEVFLNLVEVRKPETDAQLIAENIAQNNDSKRTAAYRRLADVVILASLAIAGCTLAVSVVAGLNDRRRPFSLLRLTGVPLGTLRRIVLVESAVPLLIVAVVAVASGFLAAQLFLRSQLHYTLQPPGAGYYVAVLTGLAASFGVIASTLPLLKRVTGPETARND